ncbi:hypothetical protein [Jiulongibacter sediminis]|jgi:hypothetical protein|uniref:hypothetical protein n=1 Tax=Jiulongibacter sediminis TaxID=1605367 RepID=UPI0026E9AFB1|nr:hypothetical protein [Jiulongibacter sediminis]
MTFRAKLVAFLIFIQAATAFAQTAFENTLKLYQSEIGQQAHIYSGKQYKGYSFRIQNNAHAYFLSADWQKGRLWYKGLEYTDLSLKLDLVKQKLILKDDYRMIELATDLIDKFEIEEITFLKVSDSEKDPFFYQVLAENDESKLLKLTRKIIQEDITRAVEGVKRSIETENQYFINKEGALIPINKKKEAVAILGKEYSKKDFRTRPDEYLIELFKNTVLQ